MDKNRDPIELGAPQSFPLRRLSQGGRLFRVASDCSHVAGHITRCRDFHGAAVGLGRTCTAFVPRPNNSAH